ncbi:MAG: hypothetical protein WCH98_06305 [Verrucomicrobiota bacterium]
MKIAIILILALGTSGSLASAKTNSAVYVYGEKVTPEAAAAKISQLLNGSLDEQLEAMNVLLAYPKDIDIVAFLPKIRDIASREMPYPEMDKLLKASKGSGKFNSVELSSDQKKEVDRQNLQTLAICLLSVAKPGSMDPLLTRLSASGSPSLELIARAVPQCLIHLDHTRRDDFNLAMESAAKFNQSLNLIYRGTIPYSKEIGESLIKRYQDGGLSFQDKALLLAVLQANHHEGANEIIAKLSKSESAEDRELPTVIADLIKGH